MIATFWNIDPVKILTRRELACVLEDLAQRVPRSASTRRNRTVYWLTWFTSRFDRSHLHSASDPGVS